MKLQNFSFPNNCHVFITVIVLGTVNAVIYDAVVEHADVGLVHVTCNVCIFVKFITSH